MWVGYLDGTTPMLTEYRGDRVAGGTYPAQIWRTFMLRALDLEQARRDEVCAELAKKGKKCAEEVEPTTPVIPGDAAGTTGGGTVAPTTGSGTAGGSTGGTGGSTGGTGTQGGGTGGSTGASPGGQSAPAQPAPAVPAQPSAPSASGGTGGGTPGGGGVVADGGGT